MSGSCVTKAMVMPERLQLGQQFHDFDAGGRIQVARGLVGQDQGRMRHQRASDRHALLLAARQLRRRVPGPVTEAHVIQRFLGALVALGRRHARIDQRQLDVLERRGPRQQVEILEHEADELVAHLAPVRCARAAPRPGRPACSCRASGESRQPRMFISVDLPEPDEPVMATNSPLSISRFTSRSAANSVSPVW